MGKECITPMITPPSAVQTHPRGAAEKEGFTHFDALNALQKKSKAGTPDEPNPKAKAKGKVKKPAKSGNSKT